MKRFGLTAKLFVAMLVVNVLLIVAMGAAARVSFEHSFLGYLAEQDLKRLETSTAPLAAAYADHGSWQFLQQNRSLWHQLMRPYSPASYAQSATTPLPPLPAADLLGANSRFTLLDDQGNYMFGNPGFLINAPRSPVQVNGKTVGWLLMVPIQAVTEAGDLRLQKTQREASWTIGAVALLAAILISLWLARALSAPLQRIARATHVLAGGNFKSRVPTRSGGEIGQLEEDFNHLAETLERNERIRAALVADVSHELRTPLAVMRGEIEALEVGVRALDIEAVRSLSAELQRLNRLVDDLYDLSLADAGALRYHPVELDLNELLDEMLRPMRRRLADAGITLHAQLPAGPCLVRGDEQRLEQVFANIFQNVLRYVEPGARVEVSAHADAQRVIVDIQDSGSGVPDDALEALFTRFYRVEASRSRATGGAGLGLPICRSIVAAHGGQIRAARARLGGLWIAISLPRLADSRSSADSFA